MFWLLLALLTLYAACLEATLRADVHRFGSTQAQLSLRLGRFHKTWRFQLLRTEEGHRLVRVDGRGSHPIEADQVRHSRSRRLLDALLRADKARRFLLSHIRLDALTVLILLRTEDAARTALLTGTMQGLLACIPVIRRKDIRIRVMPEFFRAHSTVAARCIIRFQLGTIILTAGMLLTALIRQQHLTESEAMTHGSSHR